MSDAAPVEQIPSELVNLKEIHERRYLRRKDAFDQAGKDALKALDQLMAEHKKAVRAYEDHYDDGLLKYGREPNKMPLDDRDAHEVKKARALKRAIEDAEAAVRREEAKVNETLRKVPEFEALKTAQVEFEDWLAKVCAHLKCCAADLDWKERRIQRAASTQVGVPRELLVLPQE